MPHDKRKKDGGTGALRLLLGVDDTRATRVTTRFDDGSGALIGQIALGRFPETATPPPAVLFLAGQVAASESLYVLDSGEPNQARLSPLPLSLTALFTAAKGRAPAQVEDARFAGWRTPVRAGATAAVPFDAATLAELRTSWAKYAPALVAAATLDAYARGVEPPTAEALALRLSLAAKLGLLQQPREAKR